MCQPAVSFSISKEESLLFRSPSPLPSFLIRVFPLLIDAVIRSECCNDFWDKHVSFGLYTRRKRQQMKHRYWQKEKKGFVVCNINRNTHFQAPLVALPFCFKVYHGSAYYSLIKQKTFSTDPRRVDSPCSGFISAPLRCLSSRVRPCEGVKGQAGASLDTSVLLWRPRRTPSM